MTLSWRVSVWLSRTRIVARYALAIPFTYRNWWNVALSKFGHDVVLELRNGTKYQVRPGTTDLAVVNEAAILNPYLQCPRITLPLDATVIDIGANIGDFTMQVARICPRGRILAVEPVGVNVRMIESQVALNGTTNVEIVRVAVGDLCTETMVTIAGAGSRTKAHAGDRECVPMVTLERLMDDYHVEAVDLLKLDCEGAEWDILPAADRVLPRVRQICMEFHCERGWTATKLADWLRTRGFIVTHTAGTWNGLLWASRHDDQEDHE